MFLLMGKTNTHASWAFGVRGKAARKAAKTHVVRSLTKAGKPSKVALTDTDYRHNAFGGPEAEAKAEARRVQMETLNPGRRFIVTEL